MLIIFLSASTCHVIINSKNIYEDVKKKSEPTFNTMFSDQLADYNASNDVYEKLGEDI